MSRIIQEIDLETRTVSGVDVTVREIVWDDGGRSYEAHTAAGEDLTEHECFDRIPTDEQIHQLLTDHPGPAGRASPSSTIAGVDRPRGGERGDSAADPTLSSQPAPGVRRALSEPEIAAMLARIDAAESTRELRDAVLRGLYDTLLADVGHSVRSLPPQRHIRPDDFAIPTCQWSAILDATANRAAAWGTGIALNLDLINEMPGHYDDATVPAPQPVLVDRRPARHDLLLTRAGSDVIAACIRHLADLRQFYGPGSPQYQQAADSLLHALAGLFTMFLGGHTHIDHDGPLSLHVSTAGGLVYGIIFHGDQRHCTREGCHVALGEDGDPEPSGRSATVADHRHHPSYPLGAPRPGHWVPHS